MNSKRDRAFEILSKMARAGIFTDPELAELHRDDEFSQAMATILQNIARCLSEEQARPAGFRMDRTSKGRNFRAQDRQKRRL
ncbi:hypothetical protein [Bradyrhizobium sp. BR 1433]|uniref:hypothetical protein n=1 Tax=Bradyrhizobium sp. BR 1433 TaxID=3447967 RepID=UPI003EE534EB